MADKKRVLILIVSLNPGGAERQVVTDSKIFLDAGYDVIIAYQTDGRLKELFDEGIRFFKIQSRNELKASIEFLGFLRKNRFDFILAHMFWAHKVAGIPAHLTGHKLYLFEHGLGLWRKWYHLAIVRMIASISHRIVTVSEAKKQIKINREKTPAGKVVVVPNCYKPTKASVIPEDQLPFKKDKFLIGFAGRFNKVKQLPLLVDVANILLNKTNNFRFVLMGDGADKEKMEHLIRETKLQDHFVLTGYIKEPLAYLAHFNAFILPSKREDFSVALLEAGGVGLPCIAFDVGGNKEIIEDGVTGYIIPPYNVKILYEKILSLIEKPAGAARMGLNAQTRVTSLYSEGRRKENLEMLFSK